ncbi:hypothetical protein GKZ89_09815 [Bacillus mangrovi]|uniref:Uncharacterized protein n=1 Tax=Metabacillus mangrovi TaxID=1491830 RepID=A0A7X2V521_9BACI|nr:hypothetical protein [Metabacillus mangrovi]MTH53699.1 hypothetical protein [Metabacillus mangrovi]
MKHFFLFYPGVFREMRQLSHERKEERRPDVGVFPYMFLIFANGLFLFFYSFAFLTLLLQVGFLIYYLFEESRFSWGALMGAGGFVFILAVMILFKYALYPPTKSLLLKKPEVS